MPDESSGRLEFARQIAISAGQKTLKYFQKDVEVIRKGDDSPVTIADREAEQHLREAISEKYPDDGILGEEYGEKPGRSGNRWILDPIDGTKSFITGVPLYGTLVACEMEGNARIGVIHIPALGETGFAEKGGGAWFSQSDGVPRPAKVSECRDLSNATFVTSQVDTFAKRSAGGAYVELEQAAYITRTWGDCYGYLLVATGRAEIMVDPMLSLWDAAAIQPVLEEAGGCFTDWKGHRFDQATEAIGTNGGVQEAVIRITKEY